MTALACVLLDVVVQLRKERRSQLRPKDVSTDVLVLAPGIPSFVRQPLRLDHCR
jgi:hypothetical protein